MAGLIIWMKMYHVAKPRIKRCSWNMARLPTFALILATALGVVSMGSAGAAKPETATFAGGCFWCMQPPLDALKGVVSTTVGYTGGQADNPTYHDVSAGGTGHAEAIQVVFDPAQVSYEKLLDVFWHNIDPLDARGQFCDKGTQYRSAIFYHDEKQKRAAEASKERLAKSGQLKGLIVTELVAASKFFPAEGYHQSYYKKNPIRYKYYRYGCRRDRRLKEVWGG